MLITEAGPKPKARIRTRFKGPELNQLFQSSPAFDFFANPNLKPETSVGWDLGVEQALASDRLRFGVTYFHNNIKNLIADNADFTSDINVGRAVTQGVEGFAAYQ